MFPALARVTNQLQQVNLIISLRERSLIRLPHLPNSRNKRSRRAGTPAVGGHTASTPGSNHRASNHPPATSATTATVRNTPTHANGGIRVSRPI
jgi:hypothetical protein